MTRKQPKKQDSSRQEEKSAPAKKSAAQPAAAKPAKKVEAKKSAAEPAAAKPAKKAPAVEERPHSAPLVRRFQARTTYRLDGKRVKSSTRFLPHWVPAGQEKPTSQSADSLPPAPVNILAHGPDGPWEPLGLPGSSKGPRPSGEASDSGRRGRERPERASRAQEPKAKHSPREDERKRERAPRDDARKPDPPVEGEPRAAAPQSPAPESPPAADKSALPGETVQRRKHLNRAAGTIRQMLQGEQADISVVVRTADGKQQISKLLERLTSQRLLYPFEIVALDRGSTDGTLDVLELKGIRTVSLPHKSHGAMEFMRRAFEETVGEMVIFLSQELEPLGNDWLDQITGELLDDRAVVVTESRMIPAADAKRTGQRRDGPRRVRYDGTSREPRAGKLQLEGACLRRSAWDAHHEGADSPSQWLQRALAGGGVKVARPDAVILEFPAPDIPSAKAPAAGATSSAPTPHKPSPARQAPSEAGPLWRRPLEAARQAIDGDTEEKRPSSLLKSVLSRLLGKK